MKTNRKAVRKTRIYQKSQQFVDGNGLLVKKYQSNTTTYLHTHDFIEIVYIVRGEGMHDINHVPHKMAPGNFYAVDRGDVHNLSFSVFSTYFNIFFTEEYLANIPLSDEENAPSALDLIRTAGCRAVSVDPFKRQMIETIFQCALLETEKGAHMDGVLVKNYIRTLFLEAKSAMQAPGGPRQPTVALPKIVDYIQMHYNEPLRVAEMAKTYGYNPVYFGRLFRRYYGTSMQDYISDLRLTYASELLTTTDLGAAEIAERVGYANRSHFYGQFRQKFGCTPREFKRREQEKNNALAVLGDLPAAGDDTRLPALSEWLEQTFDRTRACFAVTVPDGAMSDLGICPGDTAVIEADREPREGDLVALDHGGRAVLIRQLSLMANKDRRVILRARTADKRGYPDIFADRGQLRGVVTHLFRSPVRPAENPPISPATGRENGE